MVSNARALYDALFKLIERPQSDFAGTRALEAILFSKSVIADTRQLRSSISRYGDEKGKASALSRILMAILRPDLIGKEMNQETAAIDK